MGVKGVMLLASCMWPYYVHSRNQVFQTVTNYFVFIKPNKYNTFQLVSLAANV